MKLSRGSAILLAIFGIVLFFGVREWKIQKAPMLQILGEKNALLVVYRQRLFGFGDIKNARVQSVKRALTSYFSRVLIQDVFKLEVGQERKSDTFSIQRISPNCTRGEWAGKVLFFFNDDFSNNEKGAIISSGISLESDFWVMKKNRLALFFPQPKEGIFFIGERAPSKQTREWAISRDVPLVTIRDTGGFLAEFDGKDWEFKTRFIAKK